MANLHAHCEEGLRLRSELLRVAIPHDWQGTIWARPLQASPEVRVVRTSMPQVDQALAQGRVHAALVSPFALLAGRFRGWVLPRAGCISAHLPPSQALVLSSSPAKGIRRIRYEPDSAHLVELALLLWREMFGRSPEMATTGEWLELSQASWDEGLLLSGSRCLDELCDDYPWRLDLCRAWWELTGEPCVLGVWVCRSDLCAVGARSLEEARRLDDLLAQARRSSLSDPEDLARAIEAIYGHSPVPARQVLAEIERYHLDDSRRRTLALYRLLCRRHGLLTHDSQPTYLDA